MRWQTIIPFLLIVSVLSTAIYFAYPQLESEIQNYNPNSIENLPEAENITDEIQFIENLRFNHNNLTYQYKPGCEQRIERMDLAFQILENKTTQLTFTEIKKEADITISCSPEQTKEEERIFLAGEGGPSKILDLSTYPLILEGSIKLYGEEKEENCDYPVVEIHELLHVFGYTHKNNRSNLLYPYYHCEQRIHQETIGHLNNLYSTKPKAELEFTSINATKHSNYIDFELEIKNEGILDAINNELIISSEKGEIERINVQEIKPGNAITYSVKNQETQSSNVKEVTFEITTETEEYSSENNQATVTFD